MLGEFLKRTVCWGFIWSQLFQDLFPPIKVSPGFILTITNFWFCSQRSSRQQSIRFPFEQPKRRVIYRQFEALFLKQLISFSIWECTANLSKPSAKQTMVNNLAGCWQVAISDFSWVFFPSLNESPKINLKKKETWVLFTLSQSCLNSVPQPKQLGSLSFSSCWSK